MSEELRKIKKSLDYIRTQELPIGHTVRRSIALAAAPADLSNIERQAKALEDDNARLRAKCNRLIAFSSQSWRGDLMPEMLDALEDHDLDPEPGAKEAT